MNRNSIDIADAALAIRSADKWHQHWKDRLRSAVKTRETLDPAVIVRDDCCELGKWIYSDGQKAFWGRPEFQSLLLHHRDFHMLAGAIAELVNSKQYELAEAYLSDDTQFANASGEVSQALRLLEATLE